MHGGIPHGHGRSSSMEILDRKQPGKMLGVLDSVAAVVPNDGDAGGGVA
jgi:hypothetical protein